MKLLTSLLVGLLAASAQAAPKPVGPPLVVITSGTAQAQINGAGGLYVRYGVDTGTLNVRGQAIINGSLIVNGGINGGAGMTVSSLTLTGTGNNFFDLGLSSGMRFFAPNTGIVWADGSVSTSASPNAGAGGTTIIVPAGTISPYGSATVPPGWLQCDGSAVSRVTYSTLYTAIGDSWGEGDGSTTFNLPDLRGTSLRGFNDGAGVTDYVGDPGAAGRVAIMPGGNTGDDVGTYQKDELESHQHQVYGAYYLLAGVSQVWTLTNLSPISFNTTLTGGLETRPKNAAVMFIISLGQSVTYGINDPNIYSALAALAADKVNRAGDTMTGPLAVTATGAGVYGVTLSSGLNFLTPATGITWADGSVSTTASAGGGGGGGPVPADLAVDTLTFTYVMKSSEAIPTIKIGDLDQFGRSQIMNARPSSVLRLGWNPSDGDPYAEESEGIIVNGPVVNSVARIKPNRFGLTEAWDTSRYYFRADNTTLKYGNYGEPQQLFVSRVSSFTGIGVNSASGLERLRVGGGQETDGFTKILPTASEVEVPLQVVAQAPAVGAIADFANLGGANLQNVNIRGSGLPGTARGLSLSTGTATDYSQMLGAFLHNSGSNVCLAVNPYRTQDFCMEDNGDLVLDADLTRGTPQDGNILLNGRFVVANSTIISPGMISRGRVSVEDSEGGPQMCLGGNCDLNTGSPFGNPDLQVVNAPTTKDHGIIQLWTSQGIGGLGNRAGAFDYYALRGSTGAPLAMNTADWLGQTNYQAYSGPVRGYRPAVRTLATMPTACIDGDSCPGEYQIYVSTGGQDPQVAVRVTSTTEMVVTGTVTAAAYNAVGTAYMVNGVVAIDGAGNLYGDGSNITNLPSGGIVATDTTTWTGVNYFNNQSTPPLQAVSQGPGAMAADFFIEDSDNWIQTSGIRIRGKSTPANKMGLSFYETPTTPRGFIGLVNNGPFSKTCMYQEYIGMPPNINSMCLKETGGISISAAGSPNDHTVYVDGNIATSTSIAAGMVVTNAIVANDTASPALGTCTNGTIEVPSRNTTGGVDFSGANSSCAVTFSPTFPETNVHCFCNGDDTAGAVNGCFVTAHTNAGFTMKPITGSFSNGDHIEWFCLGVR